MHRMYCNFMTRSSSGSLFSFSPVLLQSLIILYCINFPICKMDRDISYISLDDVVSNQYLSNILIFLCKGTARYNIVALPICVPVADLPLTSGEIGLFLNCFAVDLIFLTLLELDCPLGNCFFVFENFQTLDLITDNKTSKQAKKV